MKDEIVRQALELGFDLCRVTSADAPPNVPFFNQWIEQGNHGEMSYMQRNASKRVNPHLVLPNAQSIIMLAASYYQEDAAPSPGSGVIARYARGTDYHDVLGEKLASLAKFIDAHGARSLWYVDTGPVLERDLAQRAGLGFIGKHTNLINRDLGNWFFLAAVLTTLPLPTDEPELNRCGTCTRCITACPTAAIRAPFHLDARRCISYLTIELKGAIPVEFRRAIGNRIYGCDDCLAVCPWNRFAREGALMKQHLRADLAQPDLIDLLRLDDAGFKRRFTDTPIIRAKRRGLLRNVCVALGNAGDASALPELQRATQDKEPLIVEHARWAIGEIQRHLPSPPKPLA